MKSSIKEVFTYFSNSIIDSGDIIKNHFYLYYLTDGITQSTIKNKVTKVFSRFINISQKFKCLGDFNNLNRYNITEIYNIFNF